MKRILMFCPNFFGYDKKIAQALSNMGHAVDLYDERVSNNALAKACIRYDVKPFRPVMDRYISRIIAENANKQAPRKSLKNGKNSSEPVNIL